ncbi:hypothetical protein LAZ67_4002720 [Cordylochernes scorpioides]|uniref:DNA helicase Pif1-like 2B domain-containing protein n=1 Tax=Cordylochernes scorpioides TaxID=51811 RepID=A0ABY6KHQ9_9ARAC|nr:hypothetical protein LAZ67_4002720 [Cordylochernes scorpioides]
MTSSRFAMTRRKSAGRRFLDWIRSQMREPWSTYHRLPDNSFLPESSSFHSFLTTAASSVESLFAYFTFGQAVLPSPRLHGSGDIEAHLASVCHNCSALHFPEETVGGPLEINEKVLNCLPNRSQGLLSVDRADSENVEEQYNYPTEFLNSLTPKGMPPHRLNLKVCSIVMLLRNVNPKQGLCNGTCMVIQRMRSHVLEVQIMTGTKVGHTVLVPKISLTPSNTNLPFILKRRQFPLRLAFAMTINKAQD